MAERRGKPRLRTIRNLNSAAEMFAGLTESGLTGDEVVRIFHAWAEASLTARPAVPTVAWPEHGWHDGRWMRDDHAQELDSDTKGT